MTTIREGVVRSSKPFLIPDLIEISDPELIKEISTSPDFGRPAQAELPWVFRLFFTATKFFYPPKNEFTLVQQSDGQNNHEARRQILDQQLSQGFSPTHLAEIKQMLQGDDNEDVIRMKCAKIIGDLILPLPEGQRIPENIAKAAGETIRFFPDVFNVMKYLNGRRARQTVEDYVWKIMPDEPHIVDYGHHLGAAAQGFADGIMRAREAESSDIIPYISTKPLIASVIRVPLRETTFGGLVPDDEPMVPNKTLVVLKIGDAAGVTKNPLFLFGTGVQNRVCPFKDMFLTTTTDVKKQLTN